ncbi:MAG: membrane integrity-associated transporter subunit PqiC [Burkholderiaceae bacterium]|nr:membrane integrity-associated transporter subunit PqiC [Roseateles sp.]MBV8470091.1 membrane integrity-associated transporter subunit PqiC [Burkholderiaceae bacterium]
MKKNSLRRALPGLVLAPIFAVGLSGCVSLAQHPVQPAVYDFGPGDAPAAGQVAASPRMPLILGEIETTALPEGTAMLYRLAYADGQQLRPYAQARWSVAPAELVRRTLHEQLSQRQPVLTPQDGAVLHDPGKLQALVLRLELQDFSQVFDGPAQSHAWLRLQATLFSRGGTSGEVLLAQRQFVAAQDAASADAQGGAKAMAQASRQLAQDLSSWIAPFAQP